jgi:L-fuconolactonase
MTRREFPAAAAAALAPQAPPMQPVIDTHQHLWNPKVTKLSWLQPGSVYDAPFTAAEYAEATKGLNVVAAVYMEVDVIPADTQRPASEGFAAYARQFMGSPYV